MMAGHDVLKKVLAVLITLSVICTSGCSVSEKAESQAEVTETVTEGNTSAVTEPVTAEPTEIPNQPETEPLAADISEIANYRVGEEDFGYFNIPADWSYIEPMVSERPSMYYGDKDNENEVGIFYYENNEEIKTCAETDFIISQKYYDNVEMTQTKIDGYEAYKISYDDNDSHIITYVFACADGVNRHFYFRGDMAIALAESVVKTYKPIADFHDETDILEIANYRVGEENFGYFNIPTDWSYIEPLSVEYLTLEYGDDINSRDYNGICITTFESEYDLKTLAENRYENMYAHYEKMETSQTTVDGYEAYKESYEVQGEYGVRWIFAGDDEFYRMISFTGSEANALAESIVQTYHLYNYSKRQN